MTVPMKALVAIGEIRQSVGGQASGQESALCLLPSERQRPTPMNSMRFYRLTQIRLSLLNSRAATTCFQSRRADRTSTLESLHGC
jgi:hypothetical protein